MMGHRTFESLRTTLFCILVTLKGSVALSQVIPDLTTGDHFRPYLTEQQKQEDVLRTYENTLQQKFPGLDIETIRRIVLSPRTDSFRVYGSNATPSIGTITNKAPSAFLETLKEHDAFIQQRNRSIIDADIALHESRNRQGEQNLQEAYDILIGPSFIYNLGTHSGERIENYLKAFHDLNTMLSGSQPINFVKAVWLVESAHDPSITWDAFNNTFREDLEIIKQMMIQEGLSPRDNLAKIMAIYKFMSDTTKVFVPSKERVVVSKPMLYDFEDFEAKNDISKVFVSKLLRTGTGQCMSLPMLYYLFAKELGADVHIAFAPEHSYITFKDNRGAWQNIELTGRIFVSEDFHWQNGFVKAGQVKSGIYLTPISEKETVAYLLTTLAIAYARSFGTDDHTLEMATIAKQHFPNSLTANMILAGYYQELWKNITRQYLVHRRSEDELAKDEKAQAIKQQRDAAFNHLLRDLGWSKMPTWAYERWLEGVNSLARKEQHLVRRRQLEHQLNK